MDRRTFLKSMLVAAGTALVSKVDAVAAPFVSQEEAQLKNVLIVAGPGGEAFNNDDVATVSSSLQKAGAKVSVVGDGVRSVDKSEVVLSLQNLSAGKDRTVLIVMAHGDQKDGDLSINMDENYALKASSLFEEINEASLQKSVDVFLTCCHGGAAIPHVDLLPKGSDLVALSPGNESVVDSPAVAKATEYCLKNEYDAHDLLIYYTTKSLKNRVAPVVATSGVGVYNLVENLGTKLGKDFTSLQRKLAHRRLDSIMGKEETDRVLDLISRARDEWGINAVDFGPALAVAHAASSDPKPIESYNPNAGSSGRTPSRSSFGSEAGSVIHAKPNGFTF